MSLINHIIEKSNFELVRSQIAAIVASELANQLTLLTAALGGTLDDDVREDYELYKESIPTKLNEEGSVEPNGAELPYLNIMLVSDQQDNLRTHTSLDGTVRYVFETWQASPERETEKGDKRASRKAQRLLGAISKILMDRNYERLLLDGQIGQHTVNEILIHQPDKHANGSDHEIYGTISIDVKVPEHSTPLTGLAWEQTNTTLKIHDFTEGYEWIIKK